MYTIRLHYLLMAEIYPGLAHRIHLIESSAREGDQSSGIDYGTEDTIAFLHLADGFGVDTVEMTHPGSSDAARENIQTVSQLGFNCNIATHVRALDGDFLLALESPVDIIHTYIPIDIYGDPRGSIERGIEVIQERLPLATARGKKVRLSAEHSFRLPPDLLQETYSRFGQIEGLARVGLAETTGMVRPSEFRERLGLVLEALPLHVPLGIHIHNDNGAAGGKLIDFMEILARQGRTGYVDAVVGGGGERNGINSWGDFLAAMYDFDPEGILQRYNLDNYAHILRFYESITGEPISRRDPLNRHAFTHKAGPHIQGLLENPARYQIISPEAFGHELKVEFGSKITGWYAIQYFAENRLGISLSKAQAATLAKNVRETAFQTGTLSDDQLAEVIFDASKEMGIALPHQFSGYERQVAYAA